MLFFYRPELCCLTIPVSILCYSGVLGDVTNGWIWTVLTDRTCCQSRAPNTRRIIYCTAAWRLLYCSSLPNVWRKITIALHWYRSSTCVCVNSETCVQLSTLSTKQLLHQDTQCYRSKCQMWNLSVLYV